MNRAFGKRLGLVLVPLALLVTILDQWTKYLITSRLPLDHKREVIHNFFYIVHVVNTGAAWGILRGRPGILAVISLAVLIIIIVWFRKLTTAYLERELAMALLLGGIAANLIDRLNLIARPSAVVGVVDFISFQYVPRGWEYPAFNVADMAITIAVFTYCISSFIRPEKPGPKKKPEKKSWRESIIDLLRP